jgi:hypothetical protein
MMTFIIEKIVSPLICGIIAVMGFIVILGHGVQLLMTNLVKNNVR